MAKTIVFKPEFEKKLKDLKIKTKFVKNYKNPKWLCPDNTITFKQRCDNAFDWLTFICCAFSWSNSPEGFNYWYNIADQ